MAPLTVVCGGLSRRLRSVLTELIGLLCGTQIRSLAGPAARNVMSRKTVMPARSSATHGSLAIRYQNRHHGPLFDFGCLQCRSNRPDTSMLSQPGGSTGLLIENEAKPPGR